MSFYRNPASAEQPYKDPTPLPADVPKVQELGTTSAPLKSAAFFIGAYCKDYNGVSSRLCFNLIGMGQMCSSLCPAGAKLSGRACCPTRVALSSGPDCDFYT